MIDDAESPYFVGDASRVPRCCAFSHIMANYPDTFSHGFTLIGNRAIRARSHMSIFSAQMSDIGTLRREFLASTSRLACAGSPDHPIVITN